MARPAIADQLQVYAFWLFDISIIQGLNLPVFSPLSGFARISSPEITLNQEEITEVNWPFPVKVLKSGSVGNLSLARGSTFWNSDFWIWTITAAFGDVSARRWLATNSAGVPQFGGPTVRRNLVLVQFFPRNFSIIPGRESVLSDEVVGSNSIGPFEHTSRLPHVTMAPRVPAKAWMLYGCVPIRCKPSGDFDASVSDISMQELDISVDDVEEVSLADTFLK